MNKTMLFSFLRVFAAAAFAAYLTTGKAPLDVGMTDLKAVVNAGLAALILTVVNYLRSGETRFGRTGRVRFASRLKDPSK